MEIKRYEDKYLDSLNILLTQAFQVEKKSNGLDSDIELIAVIENKVIGYLLLNKNFDCIRNQQYYYVNYVCVLDEFRNQGVATKMFNEVFILCKNNNISYLELTSNMTRMEAHRLYKKLGFQVRNTTVFRKDII